MELLGIPFVGSGVLPSAMALNKKIAKELFKSAGLNVIKDIIIHKGQEFSVDHIRETIGSSLVVKPVNEGSSLGMSICHSRQELLVGMNVAFQYDQGVMVEKYIQGREMTCCIIGNKIVQALPLVEIIPNKGRTFFDYKAKYTTGGAREICPAPMSKTESEEVQSCAKKAHMALKCRVWSRTDMIIHDKGVYVLETNTIPGMTETSLVPLAARTAGMSLSQLLDKLIGLSLEPE